MTMDAIIIDAKASDNKALFEPGALFRVVRVLCSFHLTSWLSKGKKSLTKLEEPGATPLLPSFLLSFHRESRRGDQESITTKRPSVISSSYPLLFFSFLFRLSQHTHSSRVMGVLQLYFFGGRGELAGLEFF